MDGDAVAESDAKQQEADAGDAAASSGLEEGTMANPAAGMELEPDPEPEPEPEPVSNLPLSTCFGLHKLKRLFCT
jgi:hypothetical protein|eukprot:COSAG02_NODE_233_length_27847_cov_20.383055_8_plen_75_part_00